MSFRLPPVPPTAALTKLPSIANEISNISWSRAPCLIHKHRSCYRSF